MCPVTFNVLVTMNDTKYKKNFGNKAEELACEYLSELGYKIVERNFLIRGGEVDIIAWDKNTLVFVEVKARFSHSYGTPFEAITYFKIKSLLKTALVYIQKRKLGDISYRFDAVSIDYTKSFQNPDIDLMKNIIEG